MSVHDPANLVRVKVLKPLRQHDGMVRYPGEMIALPRGLATEFKEAGACEEVPPLSDD